MHIKHPIQDSINSRLVATVKVLFDRLEPTDIVVCVWHNVHVQDLVIVNRGKLGCVQGRVGRGRLCMMRMALLKDWTVC